MSTGSESASSFASAIEGTHEKLAKALGRLGDDASEAFSDVVSRFDRKRAGALDDEERGLAVRVLSLLHRPSPRGLELLASILGYFDSDKQRALDYQEAALATEVLELFCKADSENDTLSNKELEVLHAVLEGLDVNGDGVVDAGERRSLRDDLWDPPAFLAKQKAENPRVREVLGLD